MIVVAELDTPFDDIDSPATVATPSCCCCCCCCIASVASAMVVAGRVVAHDAAEADPPPSQGARWLLITAAVLAPALSVALVLKVASDERIRSAGGGLAITMALTGFALFSIRLAAGASWDSALVLAIALPIGTAAAIVVELFLVLFTVGVFWITVPFWIWVAVRATDFGSSRRPPPDPLPPWLAPPPGGVMPTEPPPIPPPSPPTEPEP